MRVLIVEDDPSVGHWLSNKFYQIGYECRLVEDGETAFNLIDSQAFDAVVLDRKLPGMDGIEVLKKLDHRHIPPVLILSANDDTSDRVEGLRAGAQDYLGKPFDFTELLLRLELLVQRQNRNDDDLIEVADLVVDIKNRRVFRDKREILLTDKEFKLLTALAERKGRTVSRAMLLEKVWGYSFDPQTNLIDVHLSKLRQKIDKGFERPLIRTIRAIGYVIG